MMTNKNKLKLFITFLKQERIYKEYLKSLNNGKNYRELINCESNATDFIVNQISKRPFYMINSAFEWSSNRYPHIDWCAISLKWVDYYRNNIGEEKLKKD